jgi:hypothetical protein
MWCVVLSVMRCAAMRCDGLVGVGALVLVDAGCSGDAQSLGIVDEFARPARTEDATSELLHYARSAPCSMRIYQSFATSWFHLCGVLLSCRITLDGDGI